MYILEHSFVPRSGWSTDGGYCKYCVLIAKCGPTVTQLRVLVNKPLTNFKKAIKKLDKHFLQFHKSAVEDVMMFSEVQQNKALAIDQQLNILTLRWERIAENHVKLRSIIETIIFCGRQGIALRGHRDDQTLVESNPLSNHGTFFRIIAVSFPGWWHFFLALLQFCVQAGDQFLGHHLETAPANALYNKQNRTK